MYFFLGILKSPLIDRWNLIVVNRENPIKFRFVIWPINIMKYTYSIR